MEKRLTLLIDADDTVLDFDNSERDSIILLCKDHGIADGERVADKFKQINRRMWDMFERGEITREQIFYTRFEELFDHFGLTGLDAVRRLQREYGAQQEDNPRRASISI